jgi:hypothetical protein
MHYLRYWQNGTRWSPSEYIDWCMRVCAGSPNGILFSGLFTSESVTSVVVWEERIKVIDSWDCFFTQVFVTR